MAETFEPRADEPSEPPVTSAASGVEKLLAALKLGGRAIDVTGVTGAARGLLVRKLLSTDHGPVVAIAADDDAADALEKDLAFFLSLNAEGSDAPQLLRFQPDPLLPYDEFSPNRDLELARLRTLFLLAHRGLSSRLSGQPGPPPTVLIASVRGLLRKVMPRRVLEEHAELLGKGVSVDRD